MKKPQHGGVRNVVREEGRCICPFLAAATLNADYRTIAPALEWSHMQKPPWCVPETCGEVFRRQEHRLMLEYQRVSDGSSLTSPQVLAGCVPVVAAAGTQFVIVAVWLLFHEIIKAGWGNSTV